MESPVTTLAPPVASREAAHDVPRGLELFELFLKREERIDELIRVEGRGAELLPRFLALALVGLTAFGIVITVLMSLAGVALPLLPRAAWQDGSAPWLILAYDLGSIAALGICLPSFYFYCLLAGLRIDMVEVTAYALKGVAASAVFLLGALPVYVAMGLGVLVFAGGEGREAALRVALLAGLALPPAAGLWGLRAIFRGFLGHAASLPPERRERRTCFLRRLVTAWCACYVTVTPVMVYTLWHKLAAIAG